MRHTITARGRAKSFYITVWEDSGETLDEYMTRLYNEISEIQRQLAATQEIKLYEGDAFGPNLVLIDTLHGTADMYNVPAR